ncbi:MAG: hypothetical protein ACI89E_002295, partial [Planctomycetota bacterium]
NYLTETVKIRPAGPGRLLPIARRPAGSQL